MKKLFTAIQKNETATVKSLLLQAPESIFCVSKGSPKQYDGQSPLQVALKTADSEIVRLLLDFGADVNFMEDASCSNLWRAPVIHDAINRAIMKSRWNVVRGTEVCVENTQEQADAAFLILKQIVASGADANAKDSFGNCCISRACLQANQILPRSDDSDRVLTTELRADLARIFDLLIQNGADLSYAPPSSFGKTVAEAYADSPAGEFLK